MVRHLLDQSIQVQNTAYGLYYIQTLPSMLDLLLSNRQMHEEEMPNLDQDSPLDRHLLLEVIGRHRNIKMLPMVLIRERQIRRNDLLATVLLET